MPAFLVFLLIAVSIFLIAVFVFRPQITVTRGGKIMAFLVLFVLPVLCATMGASAEMERSKSTSFCLSCHIMEPYGKSLRVDDSQHLAAAHFQNHRVPVNEACYTCHTNYAMFGGIKAKLGGLRHIYVYYLTTPPAPEDIKLYEPFNNRECLHCHNGARSFEEGAVHTADPDLLPAIKSNKKSCTSSGCHDIVHDLRNLKDAKFWKGGDLMLSTSPFDRKLQLSGIILILGLLVEALCLLFGHGAIAFLIFAGLGGILLAAGILLYLYSLASSAVEPNNR